MRQRPFRRGHVYGNLSGTRVRQSPTPIRRFQRKYEREVWANRTNRLPLRYKRPSEFIVPPFTSACNASGHHSRSSLLVSRCRVAEAMDVIPRATWHVHEQKVVVNSPVHFRSRHRSCHPIASYRYQKLTGGINPLPVATNARIAPCLTVGLSAAGDF